MKIYYSSMFLKNNVENFEELISVVDPKMIQLYLDTNLCVYLRDFYREPNGIIKKSDGTWNELKKFLYNVEQSNLLVDYSLGVEEACRNLNNFEINFEKLSNMVEQINNLFNMDYLQMIEHSKLIKFEPPVKDKTTRKDSKMNSLNEVSRFQNLLYVNYACLLKLYILGNVTNTNNRVDNMKQYINFLDKEIDLISTANLIFGYHFFSGNSKIKKMIHSSQKTVEHKIHALWNAAIDLTFPTLISMNFAKDNTIPVFVTCDERLWIIFNSMKARVLFTENAQLGQPPILEIDLSTTNWKDQELNSVDKYFNVIQDKRRTKFIYEKIDICKKLNELREVCFNLEKEAKRYM